MSIQDKINEIPAETKAEVFRQVTEAERKARGWFRKGKWIIAIFLVILAVAGFGYNHFTDKSSAVAEAVLVETINDFRTECNPTINEIDRKELECSVTNLRNSERDKTFAINLSKEVSVDLFEWGKYTANLKENVNTKFTEYCASGWKNELYTATNKTILPEGHYVCGSKTRICESVSGLGEYCSYYDSIPSLVPKETIGWKQIPITSDNRKEWIGEQETFGKEETKQYKVIIYSTTGLKGEDNILTWKINPTGWWDSIYAYRQQITINNDGYSNSISSELNNVTFRFQMNTSNLITSGKLQADCGDIAVMETISYSINQSRPFWIDKCGVNGANITVRLENVSYKLPSKTIYLYYGNATKSDYTWNITEVFDLADSGDIDITGRTTIANETMLLSTKGYENLAEGKSWVYSTTTGGVIPHSGSYMIFVNSSGMEDMRIQSNQTYGNGYSSSHNTLRAYMWEKNNLYQIIRLHNQISDQGGGGGYNSGVTGEDYVYCEGGSCPSSGVSKIGNGWRELRIEGFGGAYTVYVDETLLKENIGGGTDNDEFLMAGKLSNISFWDDIRVSTELNNTYSIAIEEGGPTSAITTVYTIPTNPTMNETINFTAEASATTSRVNLTYLQPNGSKYTNVNMTFKAGTTLFYYIMPIKVIDNGTWYWNATAEDSTVPSSIISTSDSITVAPDKHNVSLKITYASGNQTTFNVNITQVNEGYWKFNLTALGTTALIKANFTNTVVTAEKNVMNTTWVNITVDSGAVSGNYTITINSNRTNKLNNYLRYDQTEGLETYKTTLIGLEIIREDATTNSYSPKDNLSFENQQMEFILNSSSSPSIKAWFNYNGTQYLADINISNGYSMFQRKIIIPMVKNDNIKVWNDTMFFFWNYSIDNSSYSQTDTYNQTVFKLVMSNCSDAELPTTYNITLKYEINNSEAWGDLDIAFTTLWIDSKETSYRNWSFGISNDSLFENKSKFAVCRYPKWANISTDAELKYSSTGYSIRNYYLSNSTAYNTTQNVSLYLIDSASDTPFLIETLNENNDEMADVYIFVQRYYPEENLYRTVEMGKTDTIGRALIHLIEEDVFYRFIFVYNEETIFTSTKMTVQSNCAYTPCIITFYMPSSYSEVGDIIKGCDGKAEYSMEFDDNTNKFVYTFVSTSGTFQQARLWVSEESALNGSTTICDEYTTSSSATMMCSVPNKNATYIGRGYIQCSPMDPVIELVKQISQNITDIFGSWGLFLSLIIILIAFFAGIWNFAVSLIFSIGALFFLNIIHFISFPTSVLMIFIILGALLVWRLKT